MTDREVQIHGLFIPDDPYRTILTFVGVLDEDPVLVHVDHRMAQGLVSLLTLSGGPVPAVAPPWSVNPLGPSVPVDPLVIFEGDGPVEDPYGWRERLTSDPDDNCVDCGHHWTYHGKGGCHATRHYDSATFECVCTENWPESSLDVVTPS